MKQSVNLYDFRQAFQDMGRGDNFSYEGLGVLFDWLEKCEDDTGAEMELDVIALCCDFSEYDLDQLQSEFGDDEDAEEERLDIDQWVDWLNERAVALRVDENSVIVQAF